MRLSKTLIAAFSLGAAATVMAASAQAAEVKLKAASFLPTRTIYAKYFGDWIKEVNRTCKGQLRVSIVGPAAIRSLEQWNAVKTGVVDMHYGPPNYYKGTMPEASATDLASNETADRRKNGAWALLNEQHKKKMNSVYLTQIVNGLKFFLYTVKLAPNKRFDGFRLRSVPIYDTFFKSLGANPVRMGAPSVHTALERNVVDGMGWPLWGVNDFGWHKFLKYRYEPGFLTAGVNVLFNQDKWNTLTGAQRECLMDRTVWLENIWPQWRAEQNKKEQAMQDKAGIKAVAMGPAFPKAAYDLYLADLRKANAEFIDKILPLLH